MSESVRLSQTMPATAEAVEVAHEQLAALWADDGTVAAPDKMRFELAVIEILGNIVEHAFLADERHPSARQLALELHLSTDGLEAVLCDNGVPAAIDLSAAAMPDAEAESGRGLALALAAVESVDYERDGGRNVWRIRCERRPG